MAYLIKDKASTLRSFRRVPCSSLVLFIYIYRHAGLEFHGEFVLVDSDLFNQTPDKLLKLVLADSSRLSASDGQEPEKTEILR